MKKQFGQNLPKFRLKEEERLSGQLNRLGREDSESGLVQ
ncbi:MAG: hypothetical protein JWQ21_2924 [Herminiimonas sp.]|nr:hypothetical protein [Herminiimonas sp.]